MLIFRSSRSQMIFKIAVLEAATRDVCKKGVLKNFAKFTGKHQCQILFLNFIKKKTLTQLFSCEFCEIYKNTFCYRIPLVAASGVLINFATLEPFSNKVAGLFNRIPIMAPSDFSLQQVLFCS